MTPDTDLATLLVQYADAVDEDRGFVTGLTIALRDGAAELARLRQENEHLTLYGLGDHQRNKALMEKLDAALARASMAEAAERELARLRKQVDEYPPGTTRLEVTLTEALKDAERELARLREERDAAQRMADHMVTLDGPNAWAIANAEKARAEAAERELALLREAQASLLAEQVRLQEGLRRIANRYCLHTKGDRQDESACLDKPPEQWCSVCIARALLADTPTPTGPNYSSTNQTAIGVPDTPEDGAAL